MNRITVKFMKKEINYFLKPHWSKIGFYGEKWQCKKCGKQAEEDLKYGATSTGRKVRCKNCKIKLSVDETTLSYNPEKWKEWENTFKTLN